MKSSLFCCIADCISVYMGLKAAKFYVHFRRLSGMLDTYEESTRRFAEEGKYKEMEDMQ